MIGIKRSHDWPSSYACARALQQVDQTLQRRTQNGVAEAEATRTSPPKQDS